MAIHFKSTTSYKILVLISALLISAMAATFSVTGIAALFSGYYVSVAIMMGVLEFGKIVVASFMSRFWDKLSVLLKIYFSIAVTVLIIITSGGIFGYLSDAYQKTKGNYDVIESQVILFDKKLQVFQSERGRYEKQLTDQQKRLDAMYGSENNNNWTIDNRIKSNEKSINDINIKLNSVNDSISYYESKKALTHAETINGELGPLKYMSGIFGTDMDTIVKYFIFLLIFVFDPLAILLFVSINVMNRKQNDEKDLDAIEKNDILESQIENVIIEKNDIPQNIETLNDQNTSRPDNISSTTNMGIVHDTIDNIQNNYEIDEYDFDIDNTEEIDEYIWDDRELSDDESEYAEDIRNVDGMESDGVIYETENESIEDNINTEESEISDAEEEWIDISKKNKFKINEDEFIKINEPQTDDAHIIAKSSANYKP
jgi:peptidoglycan hydrolase CwlO-like protein